MAITKIEENLGQSTPLTEFKISNNHNDTSPLIFRKLCGEEDPAEYQEFTLSNGMRVILINNKESTQSSASLSVWTGFWSDPKEHAGMAHCLEHMLLRGSEKYPEPYYFQKYITESGGTSNAITSAYTTTYYHILPSSKFEHGLDVFSEFLKHPVFDAGSLERELEAIYSEFDMRKTIDSIRNMYTLEALINSSNPDLKFNVGCPETLRDVKREQIISFWKYYYRPERMCLVIYSPEEFETMKEYAEKYFSGVKAHENAPWTFEGEPPAVPGCPVDGPPKKNYDTVFQGVLSDKVIVQRLYDKNSEQNSITLLIPLPSVLHNFKEQITEFLRAMMIMGTNKNIYNILEKKGVIISHSVHALDSSEVTHMAILFTLPKASLESVSSILDLVEKQLKMIEENVSESLYNYYKKEKQDNIQYFIPHSNPILTVVISSLRFSIPLEYILTTNYVWDKYNPSKFQEFIKLAQDRSRWAVFLHTNSLFAEETFQKEPMVGVEYLLKDLSKKTDEHIDALSSMLVWNKPEKKEPVEFEVAYRNKKSLWLGTQVNNIVIPEDTTIEEYISLEHIRPGYQGYWINKKSKNLRNVIGYIIINAPQTISSIESYVGLIGHMHAFIPAFYKQYQDELNRANAIVTMSTTMDGKIIIYFACNPFNSCDLLAKFLTAYQEPPVYLRDSISQKAQEYFQNIKSQFPYTTYPTYSILKSKNIPFFEIDDCLAVAKDIKAENVTPISEGDIKLYLFGNTYKEEFEEMNEVITRFITPKEATLKPTKPYLNQVNMATSDPENRVIAIVHHIETPFVYRSYIISCLISLMKNEEFCEKLRGQECAGYALGMTKVITLQETSVMLFVQTTKPYEAIHKSMLAFLNGLGESFKKLTENDFAKYKESQKDIFDSIESGSPNDFFTTYKDLLQGVDSNINVIALLKENLASLTLGDFIEYWDKNYKEGELLHIHISNEFSKVKEKA
ncbi:insulysin [Nematocida sp. LUAm3]|nr:insulysin [Nematocida sp. LUAm3]KAI5176244.1 insulysin [Nematocida sp. LUAm2]KAI5176702.1 insulysin [Nematocida sp. LUAm1]